MTTGDVRSRGSGRSIQEMFSELKQRGPQIMVTGDVPESVSQRASRRLLGHPEEHRYRVLALTDSAAASDRWLPGDVEETDDSVAVVRDNCLRGGLTETATASGLPPKPSVSLATRVDDEIAAWTDGSVDPPTPAVLRVGVYSLESLLEENGVEAVRALTYRLTGAVRRTRGMGHYHLPREPDSQAVEDLRYVFDARLELRDDGVGAEQRWHIPGTGTTGWVALSDDP